MGVSLDSFKVSFLEILRPGYTDLVCHYNLPLGQMLYDVYRTNLWSRSWDTDVDDGLFRLLDRKLRLVARVTS